ncbi:hypothetical protein DPEC_G00237940 [Dallia pectoralis]|uniref:Uncharacterized protein n=1 Tax=Dallia pectoralis TaxID=75939 RepID=A0ACC2FYQ1_DALPE|nr:hypothetical protein DPEC_G00237940 [Dallia pectoralis]
MRAGPVSPVAAVLSESWGQSPKVPTLTSKTSMPGYQRRLSGLPCPTPGEVIRGRFLATKNPGVGGRKSLKRCLLRTVLGRSPLVEAICSQLCRLIPLPHGPSGSGRQALCHNFLCKKDFMT